MDTKEDKHSLKFHNWAVIRSALTHQLEDKLRTFDDFFSDVERMYARSKKTLEKEADKMQLEGAPDEAMESYGEMIDMIDSSFLRTFRYSMLVSLYSIVENSLRLVCGHLNKKLKTELPLERNQRSWSWSWGIEALFRKSVWH